MANKSFANRSNKVEDGQCGECQDMDMVRLYVQNVPEASVARASMRRTNAHLGLYICNFSKYTSLAFSHRVMCILARLLLSA